MFDVVDRYSRQMLFPGIGKEGQKKLSRSYVVVVGCGGLGTVIATCLVRAGVGRVRIIDRDFIEYHNLQRQVLFDEEDIRNELPKAIAAERHLKKVNSSVEVEGIVADVNFTNIERFVTGADLILDGLDNLETRLLINDTCLKHKIPWVYGGAVAAIGMTMNIIPGETPCLRCIGDDPARLGAGLTCDTAGVISPAPFIIGCLQSAEALKILVGARNKINRGLIFIDVWEGSFHRVAVGRRLDCPACHGKYEFLEGKFGIKTTTLCGQNAVHVVNTRVGSISLEELAARLKLVATVSRSDFMLRFKVDDHEMVVFADGRAIISNTTDESLAKALYEKYIGT